MNPDSKLKVSIILPTFNSEKKILNTINSINNQNYLNIEIIVIDKSSTDNTKNLLKKLVFPYKLYNQVGFGIWNAMNYGILKATGEILFFLNSDDYISCNSISSIVYEFNHYKCDACFLPTYSAAGYLSNVSKFKACLGMHKFAPGHSASFAIKKKVHLEIGKYNDKLLCSDHEIFYKLKNSSYSYKSVINEGAYGVFSYGGASNKIEYIDKMIEEWKFRRKINNLEDAIYFLFLGILKIAYGFFIKKFLRS